MKDNWDLVTKIFETISKLTSLERRRNIIYKGMKLYPSEIHLLLFIYHIQDKNITQIANHLGLTKGAISQTLSRLNRKGIIVKETEPLRKNQLHIQFTEKGKVLMDHVNEFRSFLETEFISYLESKSSNEKNIISEFLDTMVSVMYKKI